MRDFVRLLLAALILLRAPTVSALSILTVTGTGEPATITDDACAPATGNATCPHLRDAINHAATGDFIDLTALDGQIITLSLFSNAPGCQTDSSGTCVSGTATTEFGPTAFFITGNKALTIDASGGTRGVVLERASGPAFRLFDVDHGASLTLRGLTLTGGLAQGGSSDHGGGALGGGGAIFNQGTLTMDQCTLSTNQALGGSAGNGSGVYGGAGVGGDAAGSGGGIPNGASSSGQNSGGFGGGGSAYSIGGSGGFGGGGGDGSFPGGNGGFGGGGGAASSGPPGSTGGYGGGTGGAVIGGGGAGFGGAIFNDAGNVYLTNTTLVNNSALRGIGAQNGLGYGGAVFNYNGTLTILFSTIANNVADDAGAIFSLGDGNCMAGGNVCATTQATLTLNNSIVAGTTASGNAIDDIDIGSINTGASYSGGNGNLVMLHSGFSGGVVSSADPGLSPLAGGGGLVNVMIPLSGSAVLDSVALADCPISIDQRGLSRPQGVACDIGAVESDRIFSNGFGP